MRELIINENYKNKNIYYVIKKEFPHLSISSLNKVFRLRDVKVNGNRIDKSYIVNPSDIVQVYLSDNTLFGISEDIFYAYEDDNMMIAYKPKGILSTVGDSKTNKTTIYFDELVRKDKGYHLVICHRLDTNTEGLVIFAKNKEAESLILTAFEKRNIQKEYITLVYGKLPKKNDILSDYILTDKKAGISHITSNKNAKSCITEYTELAYIKDMNCSLVLIKLHTGRTHQIRAHMKYIGNPIIGDPKYSTNEINDKFKLYSQVLYAVKYSFNFNGSSKLRYLNDISIDISKDVISKIYKLLINKK